MTEVKKQLTKHELFSGEPRMFNPLTPRLLPSLAFDIPDEVAQFFRNMKGEEFKFNLFSRISKNSTFRIWSEKDSPFFARNFSINSGSAFHKPNGNLSKVK